MRGGQFPPHDRPSLTDAERSAVRQDLVDVSLLKDVFGREGIKGAAFYCERCRRQHYLEWELIAGTLHEVLEKGHVRAHEPACDPDPDDYVSWDYARGLLDGFESYRATQPEPILVQVLVNGDAGDGHEATAEQDHVPGSNGT